jgi:hypothetical protein
LGALSRTRLKKVGERKDEKVAMKELLKDA